MSAIGSLDSCFASDAGGMAMPREACSFLMDFWEMRRRLCDEEDIVGSLSTAPYLHCRDECSWWFGGLCQYWERRGRALGVSKSFHTKSTTHMRPLTPTWG